MEMGPFGSLTDLVGLRIGGGSVDHLHARAADDRVRRDGDWQIKSVSTNGKVILDFGDGTSVTHAAGNFAYSHRLAICSTRAKREYLNFVVQNGKGSITRVGDVTGQVLPDMPGDQHREQRIAYYAEADSVLCSRSAHRSA
jgi:hypothetical protein